MYLIGYPQMGRIILPEQRTIETPDNCIRVPGIGLAGKYRMQVTKGRTGKLKYDSGWFDNLITDRGLVEYWNLPRLGIFDSGSLGAACAVGTGNTTPQITDVGLANYTASGGATAGGGGGTGFPPPNVVGYVPAAGGQPAYWFMRYIYLFATGVAAGNLTEVGAYPGGGNFATDLFSRALIVDDAGNPTAITVLSDEILNVTWELRYYLDLTDHSFGFNLNGSPVTGTYRLMQASTQRAVHSAINSALPNISMYSGTTLGNVLTGAPTGQLGFIAPNTTPAPSFIQFVNDIANSGTCYADVKATFPTGVATGTIGSFSYQGHMWTYQFGNLSVPIPKTAGQQLQVNFRQSWGRFTG
jgi:hypothetical protein